MATLHSFLFFCISSLLIVTLSIHCAAGDEERKVQIVYMGYLPKGEYNPSSHHHSILQDVLDDGSLVSEVLVRSYKRSFNGFAAKLTDQERDKLARMDNVVSVFPSRTLQLQTTRSWDFMGFAETVERKPGIESDVIVGLLDTGIWPESESFSDEGYGPTPKKWKGSCEGGSNFTCNNKIVGARVYILEQGASARDTQGHGTHTASTAAGNKVTNASFYGLAIGNARGAVPSSRIASYAVCGEDTGCYSDGILAAFDDAIADGVDIISVSIGGSMAFDFNNDPISIGSFHAMKNGVLTSNSAGNDGPDLASSTSVAPWMLSVAASTTDRQIVDKVHLGDGVTLVGSSINPYSQRQVQSPLVYGKEASSSCPEFLARGCTEGCLDKNLVKGKIVVCDSFKGVIESTRAGANGSIISPFVTNPIDVASNVPLPATVLSVADGDRVRSYINSSRNPQANILRSEAANDSTAPIIANFSSRGPNPIAPDILKPDITAPGVTILAAYSPLGSLSISPLDTRSVNFTMLSGTSMSCPHAAGAAAYVKTFHPEWSPSAIKSALMTTAWKLNATQHPQREFAYGAGHIDPVKAINPGLVYEAVEGDYIKMLCNLGYDASKIKIISGDNISCPEGPQGSVRDLNYPSMAAQVEAFKLFTTNFSRTVTNVGLANSTYKAKVTSDSQISVAVKPEELSFRSLNEMQSFVVTVTGGKLQSEAMASAELLWEDGTYSVRSPIVVYTPINNTLAS